MTRLGFVLARTLRHEATLRRLSCSQSTLLDALAGKRVALVGNARALVGTAHGDEIDRADLVIRINRAPMPLARSHGTRTDWLALAMRLGAHDRQRLSPERILWLSPKRKRLDWRTATSPGFYLHPPEDNRRLAARLGAPPTTGALMIDLLVRSRLARLDLYGFDFFASLSLSGGRSAEQVPHDFQSEAGWVAGLVSSDRRIFRH